MTTKNISSHPTRAERFYLCSSLFYTQLTVSAARPISQQLAWPKFSKFVRSYGAFLLKCGSPSTGGPEMVSARKSKTFTACVYTSDPIVPQNVGGLQGGIVDSDILLAFHNQIPPTTATAASGQASVRSRALVSSELSLTFQLASIGWMIDYWLMDDEGWWVCGWCVQTGRFRLRGGWQAGWLYRMQFTSVWR